MPTTKVENLGSIGFIADREPITLPPNGWSDGANVQFKDGSVENFPGYAQIDTITPNPDTINFVKSGVQTFIIYAEGSAIYSYWAGTETNISGRVYKGYGWWDSCVLGGVGIINNGVENPQYWAGIGNAQDLPYDSVDPANICLWSDVGMTAKIIRPFRFHLFALNIVDCKGPNCRKVHWSHRTDPGSIPSTWNPTLPEFDAGFVELSETPGCIVDALTLRDTLQIYKDDAIYAATYTGRQDNQIFNFRVVTTKYGLYSRNCVVDIGGRHFFVGDGDIYTYDGTNFRSIADERVRDYFFNSVSRTNVDSTFVAFDHRKGQVFLCYPEANHIRCNKALVWDLNDNTWTPPIDIADANCGIFTIVDRPGEFTYETLPFATYEEWGASWPTYNFQIDTSPLYDSLVLGGTGELIEMDSGNTAKGTNISCIARRTALDLGDKADWHMVLALYIHADGDPFQVRIGYHNTLGDAVVWSAPQTFTPSTDYKLYFRVTGRLHAIEFSSNADVRWEISGYEADFEVVGRR